MKTCRTTRFCVIFAVAVMAGDMVRAQQEQIKDQDLLNLINKVSQSPENEADAAPAQAAAETNAVDTLEGDQIVESVTNEVETLDQLEDASSPEEGASTDVDNLSMSIDSDVAVASASDNLISVRLNKVGLEDAIALFAQLSGANIIVPELTEAAQVSVNLKDVEWRPALQSILATYDYELYQRVAGSNVYSVRRRPAGAPEPQVVETFTLKYATVPNASALIRKLLPENATVSEFASRNMLVVKSTESSLGEVRSVLASIDTVRQQVYIESKFMELTDDAQKDLGIDWKSLAGYGVSAKSLSSTLNHTDTDSKDTYRAYDSAGNQIDAASAPQFIDDGTGNFVPYQEVTPSVIKTTQNALSQISTAVLSADDFNVVLSAMQQNKGVNIVSNPKIIVANEEPANISIVRKEPNLKQERKQALNDTNDSVTYTLDPSLPFFEYGIKLDVVPSINTSSNITVQINPALTRKFADKQAGASTYPVIDEKSIKTVFNLASGQTAAIGGLTEATESKEEHKVPLLGSIPLLGRLFSWDQTVHGKDETVIFVTVGLANTQQLTANTGMPSDAELARRQVIQDANAHKLRDQNLEYYKTQEGEKLQDMLKRMEQKEQKRVEKRERHMQQDDDSSKNTDPSAEPVATEKGLASIN